MYELWDSASGNALGAYDTEAAALSVIRDTIELDGKRLQLQPANAEPRVIAYHKPVGELVTRSDPEGRRTVFEVSTSSVRNPFRLPELSQFRCPVTL